MTFYTLSMIAVGLSMDAFAVAISRGLAMRSFYIRQALMLAACFGMFQALMALIGFMLGLQFSEMIKEWDHWVAFTLLVIIGCNMIKESRQQTDSPIPCLTLKCLLTLGIATSVDALAVGVSFAFLDVEILSAAGIIGLTAFLLSIVGVKSGHFFGRKFKSRVEVFGGVVLILIAFNVLYEHGVFAF